MRKKQKKTLLYVVLALVIALAIAVLWLPEVSVTGSTPEWVVNLINGAEVFRDSFNATTVLIVGTLLIGSFMFYSISKNRKNKDGLKFGLVVLAVVAAYLLLFPGLAAAIDQEWFTNLSKLAIDINNFLDTNGPFLMVVAVTGVVGFTAYKYIK